jgi:hypothetical protein
LPWFFPLSYSVFDGGPDGGVVAVDFPSPGAAGGAGGGTVPAASFAVESPRLPKTHLPIPYPMNSAAHARHTEVPNDAPVHRLAAAVAAKASSPVIPPMTRSIS